MILVTGGAGFIGSNLIAALDARSERVVICDTFGTDDKWRNLAKRNLDMIVTPEKLPEFLEAYSNEIEIVFHMGAISTTTEKNVDLIVETNFRLSRMLWLWCKDNGVRFVYASSAATYGDGNQGFIDDESGEHLSKLLPLNAYGWSKNLFDRWIALNKKRGERGPSQCVGLKFFNVYGPNEYHKGTQRSVIHQIYPFAERQEPFSLFKSHNPDYPDGGQLRDFIYVGDVVQVMLWLLDHPNINGIYNIGTGKARSFYDLASAVYRSTGCEPLIHFCDMPEHMRGKYQYFTEAKMDKLRAAGYSEPFTSLEDGIDFYIRSYLSKIDPYI